MLETHGDRRRREILAAAMDVSSEEGLAGLSIGRLARETGMSKSGLFAHFGSKEELQLATIRFAGAHFEAEVVVPPASAPPGLARLRAMLAAWIGHIEGTSNRGGCFFDAASSEFSSRPGPVRDLLARLSHGWLKQLEAQAARAVELGELHPETDAALLAFRLHAYVEEANWTRELFSVADSFDLARRAIDATLASSAAAPPPPPPAREGTPR